MDDKAIMRKSQFQIPDFKNVHVVVVGDVMIDRYLEGDVRRISPEAPVPVVECTQITNRLGGAANVAINLHAMGAKVTLISVCGDDGEAEILEQMLHSYASITTRFVKVKDRPTTVKTRIMASNQQLLRIDTERTDDVDTLTTEALKAFLSENLNTHGIILQDYNKGVLTENLIREILTFAKTNQIPTFVDPKERHFFAYKGCTLFKPNKKEVFTALGRQTGGVQESARSVFDKIQPEVLLMTLGDQGLLWCDSNETVVYPTSPRMIADVCGAGDTVISVAALAYIQGMPAGELAMISNLAGGQVCEKPGVVPVDLSELKLELEGMDTEDKG